jgi:hypothetical protein
VPLYFSHALLKRKQRLSVTVSFRIPYSGWRATVAWRHSIQKGEQEMRGQAKNLLIASGRRVSMKQTAAMALMLHLGVAGSYAQPGNVNMTLSGTAARSTISLQGTPASEYRLAGNGAPGQFTLRVVSTSMTSPQASTTCTGPTKVYLPTVAGAGVLRSPNGALLKLNLTGGDDCIDFAAGEAVCTRIFQVIGGTNRFTHASGTVTLTMTVVPVLADGPNNPVFFAVTAEFAGTVSGMATDQGSQDGQP